jgi:hypothetical protein
LFRAQQVPFSRAEENLLLRLEEYVVWAGRYPAPLSLEEQNAAREGGRLTISTSDMKLAEALFCRFETLVGTYECQEDPDP